MRRLSMIVVAVVIYLVSNPCGYAQLDLDQHVPGDGAAKPTAPKADNHFAFKLYESLAPDQGNIFFSPYSLSSALTMAYEGARGETAQEMSAVLHLGNDDKARRVLEAAFIQQIDRMDKPYKLAVANAMWAQVAYPFKDEYLALVKNIYAAQAQNLDFVSHAESSRDLINSWVSDHTMQRINDLLPAGSVTPATRLVLTNAVYFKGKWETPFDKKNTGMEDFWVTPAQADKVPMMKLTHSFAYMDNDQVQVLKLPYEGRDLSMVIILPRSKNINDAEKMLTPDNFQKWQDSLSRQKVDIFLPKFKFDAGYQLGDVLVSMGMKLAFDPKQADFSGMANVPASNDFYIGAVFHEAWIDTDEEGTEAAAATGVMMMKSLAVTESVIKEFHADHPFVFLIQDENSGRILFMGRVSDPRE